MVLNYHRITIVKRGCYNGDTEDTRDLSSYPSKPIRRRQVAKKDEDGDEDARGAFHLHHVVLLLAATSLLLTTTTAGGENRCHSDDRDNKLF